jgi:excisionase family DNA binding protein
VAIGLQTFSRPVWHFALRAFFFIDEGERSLEKLLEKSEVAESLRISERHLDRERSKGRIACVRIGNRVLFRPSEVTRYVESCTVMN